MWLNLQSLRFVFTFLFIFGYTPNAFSGDSFERGSAIYKKQCIECHGAKGEGVEDLAEDPLVGTRSLKALAGRIERTMPEEEPETCKGPDAKAVAEYIYHSFYSVEARSKAARIELTRLTVAQYRNSAIDLVGGFRGGHLNPFKDERGLSAVYTFYPGEGEKKERDRSISHKQIDGEVRFDYGNQFPKVKLDPKKLLKAVKPVKKGPEKEAQPKEETKPAEMKKVSLDPDRFKVRWEGSVIAEDTGIYEFMVRTRNGVEFWLNERDTDNSNTIDGYVAPDNKLRTQSKKIFLVGGRAYPLALSYFKRTNAKEKGKKAAIELLWKPPHGVLATVPKRLLLPGRHQESFIPTANFPADDRSVGYERGTSVSRAWLDAVNQAALQAADYVGEHLDQLAGTKLKAKDREKMIHAFAKEFLARSQRTCVLSTNYQKLLDQVFAKSENQETAVRQIVILALTSPSFLYPKLGERHMTDHEKIAARLSLALWDSLPNHTVRHRAETGWYKNFRLIDQDTWKMMSSPLTQAKLRTFFFHWLEMERAIDIAKSEKVFPQYSDEMMSSLKISLYRFIDEVVWSKESDYRKLLTSDYVYLNESLSKIYRTTKPVKGADLQKARLAGGPRSGVLTHPYLLTGLAYHDNTSPIHRGVFLSRHILGFALNSPPMANEFLADEFDPSLTMREKVAELTKSKSCMACHSTINPLGFSFEHFDGIGRWRTKDQNKPVNSKSTLDVDTGDSIKLHSPGDVAKFAVTQKSAHLAFVESLFHHTVKQPAAAYESGSLDRLRDSFEKQEFSILDLLKQICFTTAIDGIEPEALTGLSTKP